MISLYTQVSRKLQRGNFLTKTQVDSLDLLHDPQPLALFSWFPPHVSKKQVHHLLFLSPLRSHLHTPLGTTLLQEARYQMHLESHNPIHKYVHDFFTQH